MRAGTTRAMLGVAALIVIITLQGCSRSPAADAVSAATDWEPLVSQAVQVREAKLRDRIIGSGIIEGQSEAIIRSRVGGTITGIFFDLGDTLESGDVLITLDDTISSINLRQLEREYENSLADVGSKEELYARGSISPSQLAQARSALDALEARLEQARDAVASSRVTTPIRGSIAEKSPNLVIGDLLQPGQQIARIIDLNDLRITLPVGQSQVFFIRDGYRAEVRVDAPSGAVTAQGVVTAVSAGSDRRTGSWNVIIDFPNPAPGVIRAGMTADVVIFHEDAPLMTVVPVSSLVFREGRTWVFTVQDGTAVLIEIDIVDQYGELAAVTPMDHTINLLDLSVLVSGLSRIQGGDPAVTGTR